MGLSGNTQNNSPDIDQAPSIPELNQEELNLIENLFSTQRYEELEKRIAHHVEQTPSALFLHNILGLSQAGLGKYDKALINYRKALKHQPDNAGIYYNIGMACLSTHDFEGAIASFNQAKELDPNLKGIDKNLGVSLNNLQQYEQAIRHYEKALEESPADHELHRNIGIACDNLGRPEVAINHYLGALQNSPADIPTYNRLGSALISIGRAKEAIRVLKQGITIAPENYDLHINLGTACCNLDQIDAATRLLTRAAELEPRKSRAYVLLGTLMQKQGKYDEALFYLDQALELDSTDPATYCLKGTTYLKSGLLQTSMDCFQQALELEPDHVDALYLLGICLNDEGMYEQAYKYFNHALSLSPGDASLHTQLGKNCIGRGLPDKAISYFNNALDIAPEFSEAVMGLAECYNKTGTSYTALEKYQQVLEIQPNSITALREFAEIISRLNTVKITPVLRKHIKSCIASSNICSRKVADIASIILKKDLTAFFSTSSSDPDLFKDLDKMTSGLLLPYLQNCQISNPDIQQIIIKIRAGLLTSVNSTETNISSNNIIRLLMALASQGFINNYGWPVTDDEHKTVSILTDKINHQLIHGTRPEDKDLLILACYKPLKEIDTIREWALIAYENCNPSLKPLLKQQIIEHERELVLAQSISQLTEIEESSDITPPKNRDMEYWDGIPAYTPVKYTRHIHNLIAPYKAELPAATECPQILIIGCRSGQTAIAAAQIYKKSDINAIDTNIAQLARGKRIADENGINNICFMQADITKLDSWNNRFDVIEYYENTDLNEILLHLKPLMAEKSYLKLSLSRAKLAGQTIPEIITTLNAHSLYFLGLEIDDPQVKQSYLQIFPDDQNCTNPANWQEFETLNPSTFSDNIKVWICSH
ncbi:MAG: tetratricopeptide repeat protein [Methyloligellaceae bacterium]